MKKSVVAVVLFLLAGASAMADNLAVYQKKEPRVCMCNRNFKQLAAASPKDWAFVQSQCNVVKIYIDEIPLVRTEDLCKFVDICNMNGIEIAVECAGLCDWRAGAESRTAELSFKDEFAKVKKFIRSREEGGAGGRIKYLDLDHPITRVMYQTVNGREERAGYHTLDSATDQLVKMMKLWRSEIPDIDFYFLTNFPNYGWDNYPAYHSWAYTGEGTYGYYNAKPELEMIIKKTKAADIPVKGITVDNPYDYATGEHFSNQPDVTRGTDWVQRLRDLQDFCKENKLEFGLIFNSERAGSEGSGSSELYSKETMDYIELYRSTGSLPDNYVIQGWYHYPDEYVPEDQPFTMTNLVKQVILKLRPYLQIAR